MDSKIHERVRSGLNHEREHRLRGQNSVRNDIDEKEWGENFTYNKTED